MELDFFAIKGAPFGRVRIGLSLRINGAKFDRMVLDPIFITGTTIL
jgi:hypothetical protein